MTRAALALATLLTLSLNGSLAAASTPLACNAEGVCAISLRMLTPPPARPANLGERVAVMVPAAARN